MKKIIGALIVAVLGFGCQSGLPKGKVIAKKTPHSAPQTVEQRPEPPKLTPGEAQMLDLTNKELLNHGLNPLRPNKALMTVARTQSIEMAKKREMSHSVNGDEFTTRIDRSRYKYGEVAENIARAQQNLELVIKKWMASPGHRKNILGKRFKEIGIGAVPAGNGDWYYTQVFGVSR